MFGQVYQAVAIPYFTGPVYAGSSTTIVIPACSASLAGVNLLGCNVPVGTPIKWFSGSGPSGGSGVTLTPLSGNNFPASLATTNLVARLLVQVPRGVQVPLAGSILFTPASATFDSGLNPGSLFVTAVCVNPTLSSYTLQVNYS